MLEKLTYAGCEYCKDEGCKNCIIRPCSTFPSGGHRKCSQYTRAHFCTFCGRPLTTVAYGILKTRESELCRKIVEFIES